MSLVDMILVIVFLFILAVSHSRPILLNEPTNAYKPQPLYYKEEQEQFIMRIPQKYATRMFRRGTKIKIKPYLNQDWLTQPNLNIENLKSNFHIFPGAENLNQVEGICKYALESYFNVPFTKIRPDWIKNPKTGRCLELDVFNSEIENVRFKKKGLGLEYQGITHYEYPNWTNQDLESFLSAQERDQIKRERCKECRVMLLEIPFTVKNNSIPLYLFNMLDSLGYTYSEENRNT